jgi:GT2 family glycosyltransferase
VSVSIVVPTHNRYARLRNLLTSIREHSSPEVAEVIVVDDSTVKYDLSDFEDINLNHIKFDSRIFVSKAKNVGWRAARTDFVFFIDDDNILGNQTLAPLLDTLSHSQSTGAVMPGVLYKSRPDLVWVYATPFRDKKLGLNLVGRNLPRDRSLENRLLRTDALPNASLVRRRALEQVGGLNERLIVSSSLDLCQRLKASGWHVVCNTASLIYHDVEVPGQPGYWAAHGSVDPELVRYNLRDWFVVMRSLHGSQTFFRLRYSLISLRFVIPNLLAYLMRGGDRRKLVRSLVVGYVEGIEHAAVVD